MVQRFRVARFDFHNQLDFGCSSFAFQASDFAKASTGQDGGQAGVRNSIADFGF